MSELEKIQLFVPKFRVEETLAEIRECLERGWTGLGYKTADMEEAWKDFTGLPHAHFLNSATAALHISLAMYKRKHGWRDGDEIITTPLTFISTNHAIRYERMKPVFADVDDYLCLDPDSIAERITSRTRAVLFVGLGGNTGQLEKVRDVCREHGLAFILDAAHMAGAKLHGRDPGCLADCACYSFQAVKNLPTADSGMVCFQDEELDREARKFSWLGISKDTFARAQKGNYSWMYDVDEIGYKYHGNSVIAAMALVALKYLEEDNAYRRKVAEWYDARLEDVNGLERVPVAPGCQSSRHLYQIMTDRRDDLLGHLNENAIFPGVHYRDNTDYAMYAEAHGSCPKSHRASERLLSLPMHLNLEERHIDRVAEAITSFLRN